MAGPEEERPRVDSWHIARRLETVADLLEIIGGRDANKAPAYRRAAHAVARLDNEELQALARDQRLQAIPGVGPALADKIGQLLATGTLEYLDRLVAMVPVGVIRMLELPGLGPKTVAVLHRELGISGIDDLARAVADGRLRSLRGFGPARERKIRDGIQLFRQRAIQAPLGTVVPIVRLLCDRMDPVSDRVAVSGDIRRGEELVTDITIVAAADRRDAIAALEPDGWEVHNDGNRPDVLAVRLPDGRPAQVVLSDRSRFGWALLFYTGTGEHLAALDERARSLGWDGLSSLAADRPTEDEDDIYSWLGLQYVAPELRGDGSEVAAAAAGRLPCLVTTGDVRGDLHVHSRWSHGLADLSAIARSGAEMGREYIGICDHSPSLVIAGGLTIERLREQGTEIDRINDQGSGCRLLRGAEVDIKPDGSLDYPDSVLSSLEVVVASVHTSFGQDRDQMTSRILRAIANPHVDIIGHLTGRLLGYRAGYQVDLQAVIAACRDRGTVLEINSAGDRLDLDADSARSAVAAGVPVSINSDAHSLGALRDVELGVMVARRAGIGPDMVINCWPLERSLNHLGRRL